MNTRVQTWHSTTVEQSLYRSGQALRALEGELSRVSRKSAHECGKVIRPTHRYPLPAAGAQRHCFHDKST